MKSCKNTRLFLLFSSGDFCWGVVDEHALASIDEEGYEIRMQIAKEIMGGKYEFVLTTHIDNENETKKI